MPSTVLRSATKRPVRYSAKWRRWHSLAKRSAYRARASWTTRGNSMMPGMSRCSAVQLRQGKSGQNPRHSPYSDRLKRRFAKDKYGDKPVKFSRVSPMTSSPRGGPEVTAGGGPRGRLRSFLEGRYVPAVAAVLTVVLALPSLTAGWILDDWFHRAVLLER